MMKANVKKMVLAAAMAAFMVYAPAMAEEADEIIEESFEAVEETAVETAPAVEIQVLGLETIATAEVPAEAAQAAEAAETEINAAAVETEAAETEAVETEAAETETVETEVETEAAQAATFYFENEEVIIRAEAAAELPANVEMQVRKLEEGSAEYEAAKQACGADDNAECRFYDVKFVADGIELAAGSVTAQVEFKTVQKDSAASQEVVAIDENGAQDVTAETAEGSNMSSVNFAM